ALVHSLNMVSIRLLESIGIEKLHTYISDTFGFAPEQMPKNLSLALGSPEISPLDLAQAYAILANGGYEIKPWLISHITDAEGQVVWRYKPTLIPEAPERVPEAGVVADARIGINGRTVALRGAHEDAKQVIDERVAFQISDMLREVMVRGTALGASIALGRPDFAGKTGTTNDAENAWFCGYNPSFVSAVWVGFDQPKSLGSSEFGATVALPIWSDFVRDISVLLPQQTPVRPLGLVAVPIDPRTGVRATPGDYTAIFELFRQEQVPEILDLEAEDTPESIF
ncbi:MAG: penicillin-binding transpeptidase domain-containing protein, partial [Gammaproteobacteria bacterium]